MVDAGPVVVLSEKQDTDKGPVPEPDVQSGTRDDALQPAREGASVAPLAGLDAGELEEPEELKEPASQPHGREVKGVPPSMVREKTRKWKKLKKKKADSSEESWESARKNAWLRELLTSSSGKKTRASTRGLRSPAGG